MAAHLQFTMANRKVKEQSYLEKFLARFVSFMFNLAREMRRSRRTGGGQSTCLSARRGIPQTHASSGRMRQGSRALHAGVLSAAVHSWRGCAEWKQRAAWRVRRGGGSDADEDNERPVTRGWEGGSGPNVPTTHASEPPPNPRPLLVRPLACPPSSPLHILLFLAFSFL